MCGIAGIFHLDNRPASVIRLKKMTESIKHRGPDGEGQFTDGPIGLGHRRLAIIDLTPAGHQPMQSSDGNFIISYNGEVYNFKELRGKLEALGHQFHSETDTEVVLKSFIEWREKCVDLFNGMFAFAIWDKSNKQLFLARDRYGKKPLYYTYSKDTFLFSSEIKGIISHGHYKSELDKEGLLEYMTFQNFFTDKTLFKNVHMFPAGNYAYINQSNKTLKKTQYWDFHYQEPITPLKEEEYVEELEFLMRQAVNRQLVSDVEIGSYLSGGMDSGAVTALAASHLPYLKTFTVGFDLTSASGLELSFDERSKAERMSYLFKTEHYEMVLKSGDMERCLPQLAYHIEEPRVGQSYPNFYASKLASKFCKVVLCGTGGDEIFGGYPWRYFRLSAVKNFEEYIDEYYAYWQRLIPNSQIKEVFSPIWEDVKHVWTRDIFRDVFKNHKNNLETPEDYINHAFYFESKTFLHGLLTIEDKLSMAHGLETRVPFLDNNLVDFAQNLPVKLKLGNLKKRIKPNENDLNKRSNEGKKILRKAMEGFLPNEVAQRKKQGFSSPDASWFKGESIDYIRSKLFDKNAAIYKYFNHESIKKMIEEHLEGKLNKRLFIWSLINLEETLNKKL